MNTPPVKIKCTRIAHRATTDTWESTARHWRITLTYQGRRIVVQYSQGSAWTTDPTVQDVLESLFLDASYGETDFDDFCRELGYDLDSRKAERTYKACESTSKRLTTLLGSDYDAIQKLVTGNE